MPASLDDVTSRIERICAGFRAKKAEREEERRRERETQRILEELEHPKRPPGRPRKRVQTW